MPLISIIIQVLLYHKHITITILLTIYFQCFILIVNVITFTTHNRLVHSTYQKIILSTQPHFCSNSIHSPHLWQ
nr:MAG TPA: hypothetical protein [Caudoviricetes sp.]